jgi:hypothetical protein
LGCVLVGPAGSNLLTGKPLDDIGHEDETVPYVRAGFAVVHFSLDGPLDDLENTSDLEMSLAYQRFNAAFAGLVNVRNAMVFILTRVLEVDPKRIYIAGCGGSQGARQAGRVLTGSGRPSLHCHGVTGRSIGHCVAQEAIRGSGLGRCTFSHSAVQSGASTTVSKIRGVNRAGSGQCFCRTVC